jgi:PadR family transcriptional regulator PadR
VTLPSQISHLQKIYFFSIVEQMVKGNHFGDLELLVMLALVRLDQHAYGVSIAREIEETGKRRVALGSVYAALERLQAQGLVKSVMGEATPERGGRAKRYFQITGSGLHELQATRKTLMSMWQDVPTLEGGKA